MNTPTNPVVQALETQAAKNLLNPITEKLGLIGGDFADVARFYINENLNRIFTKWSHQRNGEPLPPGTDIPKLLPILEQARYQSDDYLQEQFAALLESSITMPKGVLPSYAWTLSQLSADEARYMHKLFINAPPYRRTDEGELGTINRMFEQYDRELFQAVYADHERLKPKYTQARLFIHDLLRLGIIIEIQKTMKNMMSPGYTGNLSNDLKDFFEYVQAVGILTTFSFSEYGRSFITAVTPKTAVASDEK